MPERKITVEDVKVLLSSVYQGTPYDPYIGPDRPEKGLYRTIGIAKTIFTSVMQIRGWLPETIRSVIWLSFGSPTFNALMPVYASVDRMLAYISDITERVDCENFYWVSRLIGALADPHYGSCIQQIERYQNAVACGAHRLLNEYDRKMQAACDYSLKEEANGKLCEMTKEESDQALSAVLLTASHLMKNNHYREDG